MPIHKGLIRRFVVADRSMEPTLQAGQGLLATSLGAPKSGQLRCFEHGGRWLVKRVAQVHADGTMTVRADNPQGTDSRHFGPVRQAGSYWVLVAVPLRFM